ncbi:penicillin-binding protein 2B [Paenibacillus sp. 1_12]|uniref:penicillin-binding transpeptidase domain-containing protein n=1 Tax=Paenibacillus sp. 1_12 TaxID=1566278 RepID=UPI0008F37B44|nr:penicillin-binding transpeptidase domain-containing protein [Paenibacillus sp. 1_12]SFK90719.1 penicillin-binding protein 2B [Paenibacillus sp. 1_12]
MTKKVKLRSLLIGGLFTLFFVAIVGRLYWVQVVQGASLLSSAQERWAKEDVLRPVRGMIVDRNDKVLAEDSPAYTLALNPVIIQDNHLEQDVVKGLAEILKTSDDPASISALEEKIRTLLNKKKSSDNKTLLSQVEIHNEGWKIDTEVADKVKSFVDMLKKKANVKNAGIYLQKEQKRFYPGGKLASHVLGYTDKEGRALTGLESRFDSFLKGIPGNRSYEKDRTGVELPDAKVNYQPAVDGSIVRLTIDKNIQFYIESALEKVNAKYNPKSLTAIAVDPNTMEILGMASTPNFNPNKYWDYKNQSDFINNTVASQYEPGSTFKIVTLAAAVEENLFFPEDKYQSGAIQVPGRTLHDHNIVGWGPISYLDGLKRSSNVAFVKLGYEKLGQDKLKKYIEKFGFGAKTGIDLPGEIPGIVAMKYPSDYATATYGQGRITTTAIQQTSAYAAIANGGKLMVPHVVKDILNPKSKEVIQTFEPEVIRQVVSERTAKQVTEYLEQVVSDQAIGTGRNAYIEGYRVAGKTGTANKVEPGGKGYADGKWVVSFIGYAPVENPKILVTIIADEPDLGGDYHRGSEVAPPAFKEIVSQTLRYMGVPSNTQQMKTAEKADEMLMPDLTGQTVEKSKNVMNKFGVIVETIGKGSKVIAQSPAVGTDISSDQRIYVVLQESGDLPIPDMTGKSLRDAMEVCTFIKIKCQSVGEGYVASQSLTGDSDVRQLILQLKPYSELLQGPTSDAQVPPATTPSPPAKTDKKETAVKPNSPIKTAESTKVNEASAKKTDPPAR